MYFCLTDKPNKMWTSTTTNIDDYGRNDGNKL